MIKIEILEKEEELKNLEAHCELLNIKEITITKGKRLGRTARERCYSSAKKLANRIGCEIVYITNRSYDDKKETMSFEMYQILY